MASSIKSLTKKKSKNGTGFYSFIPRFPGIGTLEFKYVDYTAFNTAVSFGTFVASLNNIAAGTGVNQRVGNQVRIRALDVDVSFQTPSGLFEYYLATIVCDRFSAGLTPPYTDIYDVGASAAMAFPKIAGTIVGRFTEVGSYFTGLASSAATVPSAATSLNRWRVRLIPTSDCSTTRFDSSLSGTTPASGNLILTVGNHGGGGMFVSYHVRTWYTDD